MDTHLNCHKKKEEKDCNECGFALPNHDKRCSFNRETPNVLKKIDESDDWSFNQNMVRGKLNEVIRHLNS